MTTPEHPVPDDQAAAKPQPLFTRPPIVVVAVSVLLLLFALLAPATPGFRAVTAFAALMLLLLVRDRPKPGDPAAAELPPPPPRRFPQMPSGDIRVVVTDPGPTPDDVAWVWHQFRAFDDAETRTLEEFAQELNDATPTAPVLAAESLPRAAADELAAAMRRAGAGVEVGPTT